MSQKKNSARFTLLWALPFLAMTVIGLSTISWLVETYLKPNIPTAGYVTAIALSALAVLVTLVFLRRAGVAGPE